MLVFIGSNIVMPSLLKSSLKIGLILFAITFGTLLISVVGIYYVVGNDIDGIMQGAPDKLPPVLAKAMNAEYPGYTECSISTLILFERNNCTPAYQLTKATLTIPRRALKYAFDSFLGTFYLINNYSSEQIAAAFLEKAYWGENLNSRIISITAAAQYYFNKTPADLNSQEIATLFVLLRAPGHYSNPKNSERLTEEVKKLQNKIEAKGNL